jgi:uncharacterized protein YndB with AHSA1/START domain
MRKTGESYTTARAQLLDKKSNAASPAAKDLASIAGMSDDTVNTKTGRTWKQWTDVLDKVDAKAWPHNRIALHLNTEFGVPGWWAQTVAVGYERIRGLRQIGQRRDGTREIGRSRTLPVPIAALYRAWSNARVRKTWLPDAGVTVRKATPEKSVRLRWPDGTAVEIYFVAKGEAKSQITVQHRALRSEEDAAAMKAFWTARLDALAALLK